MATLKMFLFTIIMILISPALCTNTTTTTPTTTTSLTQFMTTSGTVDDLVVSVLESAMGYQMELSKDPDLWNVTKMIKLINDTNPATLYDPSNMALIIEFLPSSVVKRMPLWLLMHHGLCEYMIINTTEWYECMGLNITLPPIDLCVGPLIHSNIYGIIQDTEINGTYPFADCGISCATGKYTYGLSDSEQRTVDLMTIIGCIFCFVFIVFLFINQYMDQKRGGLKLRKKPLLQHIPYLITISLFCMILCMAISEIFGKETILCQEVNHLGYDTFDKSQQMLAGANPRYGDNITCGIDGILFYSSILFYIFYTALLSFVIFRSLYNPLNPLWKIRKKWWHLLICICVFSIVIKSIIDSKYDAVWPMGVCFPTGDVYNMICIPCVISCVISGFFITLSWLLLMRELRKQRKITNKGATSSMQDLSGRLMIYALGIQCALILLVMTTFKFENEGLKITDDFFKISECKIEEALTMGNINWSDNISECNELREHSMHPFWFCSWLICCVLGVLAQTILSCHDRVRDRLKKVASAPIGVMSTIKKSTIDVLELSRVATSKTKSTSNKSSKNTVKSTSNTIKEKLKLNGIGRRLTSHSHDTADDIVSRTQTDGDGMSIHINDIPYSSDNVLTPQQSVTMVNIHGNNENNNNEKIEQREHSIESTAL